MLPSSIVRTFNGLRKAAAGLKPFSESVWPGVRNDLFIAHESIYCFFETFTRELRVVDAGCGTGYGAHRLAVGGATCVIGVDIDERNIRFAKTHYCTPNLQFVVGDIHELDTHVAAADIVVTSNFAKIIGALYVLGPGRPWLLGLSAREYDRLLKVARTIGDLAGERSTVATSRSWVCPECGRKFAKRNQWHSCEVRGVDMHFQGKSSELRSLFDVLIRELQASGPLRVDAVKTSINLISKHHFGGVQVREGHLRVGFLAKQLIRSPRIVHSQAIGPNRVGHSVIVRTRKDINPELLGWLADAQAMQS